MKRDPERMADAPPAAAGFSMPAEWNRHEATWLGWPHNAGDWPGKFETIPWVYGEMIRKIAPGEYIRLLVRDPRDERLARRILRSAGVNAQRVQFVTHPTNRGWTRDTGPIFVRRTGRGKTAETAIVHFHFNAWAKYDDWGKDRRVPEMAAKRLGKRLF
ncbi:MAG: agmatine deiminase family protein, partial [Limisphaerales bacterium]